LTKVKGFDVPPKGFALRSKILDARWNGGRGEAVISNKDVFEADCEERLMAKKNYELTEGEWAIIQAVWDNEPCAAPTIQEALEADRGWSYSTVKTLMDRMVAKGLLATKRIRNLILYRSAITRAQAQGGEVMRAIRRAFDGALTPMMQFLLDNNKLSGDQLAELEALIQSKKDEIEVNE